MVLEDADVLDMDALEDELGDGIGEEQRDAACGGGVIIDDIKVATAETQLSEGEASKLQASLHGSGMTTHGASRSLEEIKGWWGRCESITARC